MTEPIETAARSKIIALQERLLREQVEKAWRDVPFYRERWEAAGVTPEEIRTLEDLRRLPVVTKADFDEDLRAHPPFGSYQGKRTPARIHASSGTTGDPRPVHCTERDCEQIAALSARRLRAQGIEAGDLVQVTLPYTLYIGGVIALEGAMLLGAGVIPTGTGAMTPTRRQIQIAHDWRPTVLCATPSYALGLAGVASDMGLNPERDFNFRIIYVTAEVLTAEMRREIEQTWNVTVFDNYGSVEAAASTFECPEQAGWHISEDAYIFEVLDLETGEPVEAGQDGVLVITSLFREASPFLRYRVGDIVSIEEEPCACGRTLRRMSGVKGRADEMLKIRGISVYPTTVERALWEIAELGSEWQLVVDELVSAREVTVEVEYAAGTDAETDEAARAGLAERVADRVKAKAGIRPRVALFAPGELFPGQAVGSRVKRKRVVERKDQGRRDG